MHCPPRAEPIPFLVTDDWLFGMDATRKQRTIAAPAAVEGVGYWSGRDVRVEFRPAAANAGIVFVRRDLPGCPRIPATVANRIEMPLRTMLHRGEASVEMVEHIMAALAGLQIDNCEIWVDQPEMPGCDGSCLPFVEALQEAGIVEQDAPRPRAIDPPVDPASATKRAGSKPGRAARARRSCNTNWTTAAAIRSAGNRWRSCSRPRFFRINLAPSRTFMLEARGGGDCWPRDWGSGPRSSDLLVFGAQRADRQPAAVPRRVRAAQDGRHDRRPGPGRLRPGRARFVAYRSGHRLNAELVRAMVAAEDDGCQEAGRRCA